MSADSPSCRAMLGLGPSSDADPNRRFLPRLPPSYGRPHHPYAAMMYPEFQYRAPPPSYQASMQEYRLRLLLLDRTPASPPPTYRSHPNNLLRGGLGRLGMDYSRPPSYRSRTSSSRQDAAVHSRQASSLKDTIEEKDGCNVTIVGTEEPPPGPVIVTISGRDLPPPPPVNSGDHIQILAHL